MNVTYFLDEATDTVCLVLEFPATADPEHTAMVAANGTRYVLAQHQGDDTTESPG